MAIGNLGTIFRQGRIQQVNNALVEEVFVRDNTSGSILITYADRAPNGITLINSLWLNVNRNTVILHAAGRRLRISDIHRGMRIDAAFSPVMTRSIPPQSNAFLIVVRRRGSRPADSVSTGRIVSVDVRNRSFNTGRPNDISRQSRFIVTNDTLIRNRAGNPIRLSELRPGQNVRVIHADFQTASIPPQTTAFYVQVL